VRAVAALLVALLVTPGVRADAPTADAPVRYDGQADSLVIARSGLPPQRGVRLAARRRQAEVVATRRAHAGLTRFVDEALSARAAAPFVAARVHAAVSVERTGLRYLADGSVVLSASAPAAPLRQAWDAEGLPWAR